MKVLFVTEKFPYPLDTGGNVRTFHMLRALSTEHDVTLLSNRPDDLGDDYIGSIRNICRSVEFIAKGPVSRFRQLMRIVSCVVTHKSILLGRRATGATAWAIQRVSSNLCGEKRGTRERVQELPYDVVHFNHLDTAQYESLLPPGMLRVVDEHNVVTNQVRTTLRVEENILRRWVLGRESRVLERVEKTLCNKMDLCITCSDTDRGSLQAMGVNVRIVAVPNGVDLDYFSMTETCPQGSDVVFVGTLDYDPCAKAVQHFCDNIWPELRKKHTGMRFIVVGRNPPKRLEQLAEVDPRIVVTGRVDDVRPYVRAAAVFIVPLLSGSGTRLKILEALALGTPVVTTSAGVEGIDAISERHLLIADGAAQFAEAVSRILQSRVLAERLRRSGRNLVEERYGWDGSHQLLLRQYHELKLPR